MTPLNWMLLNLACSDGLIAGFGYISISFYIFLSKSMMMKEFDYSGRPSRQLLLCNIIGPLAMNCASPTL
jgi:hypothetical protein